MLYANYDHITMNGNDTVYMYYVLCESYNFTSYTCVSSGRLVHQRKCTHCFGVKELQELTAPLLMGEDAYFVCIYSPCYTLMYITLKYD